MPEQDTGRNGAPAIPAIPAGMATPPRGGCRDSRPRLRGAPVPFDLLAVMVLERITRRRDVAALVGGLLDGATFSYRRDFTG